MSSKIDVVPEFGDADHPSPRLIWTMDRTAQLLRIHHASYLERVLDAFDSSSTALSSDSIADLSLVLRLLFRSIMLGAHAPLGPALFVL